MVVPDKRKTRGMRAPAPAPPAPVPTYLDGGGSARRRSPRARKTQERIIRAATELLMARGPGATSVDEVAAHAGVTKATIYYHFDSKEDLYWSVVYPRARAGFEVGDRIITETKAPDEALRLLLQAAAARALSPGARFMHQQDQLPLNAEMRQQLRHLESAYEYRMAEVIREGQKAGLMAQGDPHIITLIAIGCIARTALWYDPAGKVGPKEVSETLVNILLNGILTKSPRPHTGEALG